MATAEIDKEVKADVSSAAREVTSSAIVAVVVAADAAVQAAALLAVVAEASILTIQGDAIVVTTAVEDTIGAARAQATVQMNVADGVAESIAEDLLVATVDHHLPEEATEVPAHGTARNAAEEAGHLRTVGAQLAAIAARLTRVMGREARQDVIEDQDREMDHPVVEVAHRLLTSSVVPQTPLSLAQVQQMPMATQKLKTNMLQLRVEARPHRKKSYL